MGKGHWAQPHSPGAPQSSRSFHLIFRGLSHLSPAASAQLQASCYPQQAPGPHPELSVLLGQALWVDDSDFLLRVLQVFHPRCVLLSYSENSFNCKRFPLKCGSSMGSPLSEGHSCGCPHNAVTPRSALLWPGGSGLKTPDPAASPSPSEHTPQNVPPWSLSLPNSPEVPFTLSPHMPFLPIISTPGTNKKMMGPLVSGAGGWFCGFWR